MRVLIIESKFFSINTELREDLLFILLFFLLAPSFASLLTSVVKKANSLLSPSRGVHLTHSFTSIIFTTFPEVGIAMLHPWNNGRTRSVVLKVRESPSSGHKYIFESVVNFDSPSILFVSCSWRQCQFITLHCLFV